MQLTKSVNEVSMNEKFFELPEEKRDKIINGAVKCFAVLGYRKASTQDIAGEAGISKALIFHYFESKRELFRFAYRFCHERIVDNLKSFEYRQDEDIFSMMLRANMIKMELFKAYPYLFKFAYRAYFEDDSDVQEIVKEISRGEIVQTIPDVVEHMDRTKLREGVSPEQALQLILWVSEGYLQNKLEQDADPDSLLVGFNEWMDILRLCLYKA